MGSVPNQLLEKFVKDSGDNIVGVSNIEFSIPHVLKTLEEIETEDSPLTFGGFFHIEDSNTWVLDTPSDFAQMLANEINYGFFVSSNEFVSIYYQNKVASYRVTQSEFDERKISDSTKSVMCEVGFQKLKTLDLTQFPEADFVSNTIQYCIALEALKVSIQYNFDTPPEVQDSLHEKWSNRLNDGQDWLNGLIQ
jgi:hypothetical protein